MTAASKVSGLRHHAGLAAKVLDSLTLAIDYRKMLKGQLHLYYFQSIRLHGRWLSCTIGNLMLLIIKQTESFGRIKL